MNALTDPLATCLLTSGRFKRMSAFDMLAASEHIVCITETPRNSLSVFRFLLACAGWASKTGETTFKPEEVATFLERHRPTFNLFGKDRFLQAKSPGVAVNSMGFLLDEIPTGATPNFLGGVYRPNEIDINNRKVNYGLCPRCCFLGMLRQPIFACSAGRVDGDDIGMGPGTEASSCGGRPTGINGMPPQYGYPVGETLRQTIAMNWMPTTPGDFPAWENMSGSKSGAIGPLEGYTWLSRAIYLRDEPMEAGQCFSCGEQTNRLVKTCWCHAGWRSQPRKADWRDPHVIRTAKGNLIPKLPLVDVPINKVEVRTKPSNYPPQLVRAILSCLINKHGAGLFITQQNKLLGADKDLVVRCASVTVPGGVDNKRYEEVGLDVTITTSARNNLALCLGNEKKHSDTIPDGVIVSTRADPEPQTPLEETYYRQNGEDLLAALRRLTNQQLQLLTDGRISESQEAFLVYKRAWAASGLHGNKRLLEVFLPYYAARRLGRKPDRSEIKEIWPEIPYDATVDEVVQNLIERINPVRSSTATC